MQTIDKPTVDLEGLRKAIQEEYALVAEEPEHGFDFFVGRPLARLLGVRRCMAGRRPRGDDRLVCWDR